MALRTFPRVLVVGALLCASGGCGSSSVPSAAAPTPFAIPTPFPTGGSSFSSSTTTLMASASVLSTIWKVNGALGPVILWRGRSDWWDVASAGSGVHESSTSSGAVVTTGLRYGTLTLSLTFDTKNYVATFQGHNISLAQGTNVLFIDAVDSPSGPTLAGTLILDPGKANLDPPFQELIPVFRASPQIMTFLQCDLSVTSPFFPPLFCDNSSK
jgi:hypothetical protein